MSDTGVFNPLDKRNPGENVEDALLRGNLVIGCD
jgi:hypothetical protein